MLVFRAKPFRILNSLQNLRESESQYVQGCTEVEGFGAEIGLFAGDHRCGRVTQFAGHIMGAKLEEVV